MTDQTTAAQDFALQSLEDEIARRRNQLRRDMENLRDRIDRALRVLEDPADRISGLGVVQGQGSDIDRLCGELRALEDTRKTLKRRLSQG